MAGFPAISSFSESLRRFLDRAWRAQVPPPPAVVFAVAGGAWMADAAEPATIPAVSLYLHRIAASAHARNSRSARPPGALSLDLHYVLTAWAATAEVEHRLLGWAMEQLHLHAAFDSSVLTAEGAWGPGEAVSLFPVEMTTDEMARVFESVRRPVRVSWPFVARVVRIETRDAVGEWPPVVAIRGDMRVVEREDA